MLAAIAQDKTTGWVEREASHGVKRKRAIPVSYTAWGDLSRKGGSCQLPAISFKIIPPLCKGRLGGVVPSISLRVLELP
jgi:hypothetical protein